MCCSTKVSRVGRCYAVYTSYNVWRTAVRCRTGAGAVRNKRPDPTANAVCDEEGAGRRRKRVVVVKVGSVEVRRRKGMCLYDTAQRAL